MDLGLAGKAAIVNGASQGIGYAIAHLSPLPASANSAPPSTRAAPSA
jgi:hypothetical protein